MKLQTRGPCLLAVDPGSTKLAVAARSWGSEEINVHTVEPLDISQVDLLLSEYAVPGSAIVVEAQYCGRNVKSYGQLSWARGVVEGLARRLGYQVIDAVAASTWQSYCGFGGRVRRDRRKEKAKELASELVGHAITDSDVADAVCILHYASQELVENDEG